MLQVMLHLLAITILVLAGGGIILGALYAPMPIRAALIAIAIVVSLAWAIVYLVSENV